MWVAYQPKLDMKTKRLCGAEALVRWTHPDRGNIRPDQFIPGAEKANRIDALTYFVLGQALADLRLTNDFDRDFSVSVNISARTLADLEFGDRVRLLLDRHHVAPKRLTLEITESFEISAIGDVIGVLTDLQRLGVIISIDDYGTKFSNLEYVRQLPASEIKIDQQFVRRMDTSHGDLVMVSSTIRMAHDLGLKVVAEGVEEPQVFTTLVEYGCDVIQGYIVGRPVPIDQLIRFLGNIERVRSRKSDATQQLRIASKVG